MKCCRQACEATTEAPKADGWIYVDQASLPHWVGWWCPACIGMLQEFLTADPATKQIIERMN